MTLRITFCLMMLAATPVLSAGAKFMSGNDLFSSCSKDTSFEKGYCLGYVVGVADTLTEDTISGFSACIPANATQGQLRSIVTKWLQDNPRYRHYSAGSLAAAAISNAFPCN
jgi:hypothetical protein